MGILLWYLVAISVPASMASDSIMDIINTKEVARLIAERRMNASTELAVDQNLLSEVATETNFEQPLHVRGNITAELRDLVSRQGEKMLRSSKDALLVTKKEYLRKDWCKTEPLMQVVREKGCFPVTILNQFCYGQCNSFYIPKTTRRKAKSGPGDMDRSAFKSCAVCKPNSSTWIVVTLKCQRKMRSVLRRKKVLRIKECKCLAENIN